MEQGDGVVGLDGEFGEGATRELGAAEDEDVHARGYRGEWNLLRFLALDGGLENNGRF